MRKTHMAPSEAGGQAQPHGRQRAAMHTVRTRAVQYFPLDLTRPKYLYEDTARGDPGSCSRIKRSNGRHFARLAGASSIFAGAGGELRRRSFQGFACCGLTGR